MREIKFRAWDGKVMHQNVVMVDGNPFKNEVRAGEPMQYTGLQDSKGKDIYEGDILQVKQKRGNSIYSQGYSQAKHIEWENNFKHTVEFTPSGWQLLNYYVRCTECEVIGNVYEHPHLLEEKVDE